MNFGACVEMIVSWTFVYSLLHGDVFCLLSQCIMVNIIAYYSTLNQFKFITQGKREKHSEQNSGAFSMKTYEGSKKNSSNYCMIDSYSYILCFYHNTQYI